MFDVSFFELLVIGVVALLVIGPERLPGAIRTGALWFGRLKRTITETRSEIEKHIGADEIRRQLHNEQILASLEKLKESRAALERDLMDYQNKINAELNESNVIDQPAEITHGDEHHSSTADHDIHQHEAQEASYPHSDAADASIANDHATKPSVTPNASH